MDKKTGHFYAFPPFRLDARKRLLLRDNQPVPLTSKAFDTLLLLVQNGQRVMEKDELMKLLWPDSFVEEANLAQNISMLRKALGETPNEHRYILTVPGRGYQFVAEVKEGDDEVVAGPSSADEGLIVEKKTISRVIVEETDAEDAAGSKSAPLGEAKPRELEVAAGNEAKPEKAPGLWGRAIELPARGVSASRPARLKKAGIAVGSLAAAVGVLALLNPGRWRQRLFGGAVAPIHSIAVLPLENLSGDPQQEYFADGMTDELITNLAQIRELKVISRTSVMRYKGTRTPLPEIARQLKGCTTRPSMSRRRSIRPGED
jgi:DNA-binding winged helix-turn-helix (wHTH) protein